MAALVDASLGVDFTRARSPLGLKQFIAPHILAPDACLAEPVAFEVLRGASDAEIPRLQEQFATLPMLAAPADLWRRAAALGQACRRAGIGAGSLDLLIATTAIIHDAELVTFDADFEAIGRVSALKVKLLRRPAE